MRLWTAVALLVAGALQSQPHTDWRSAPGSDWESIFNGRDLDGWVVKFAHHELGDNYADTFRVVNGVIQVNYDKYMVKPHCVNSTSKIYGNDEWVAVEVEVLGSEHVRHLIDRQVVLEYETPTIGGGVATGFDPAIKKDGTVLADGYIGLQAESQPVEFRNIKLLNLSGCMDPKSPKYRAYFVHRDDTKCR